jgi:hypothetical protein
VRSSRIISNAMIERRRRFIRDDLILDMLIFPQISPTIVRLAPVFPRNNSLSKAQLALSSSGLTRQDRIKVPRSATRKAFHCAGGWKA